MNINICAVNVMHRSFSMAFKAFFEALDSLPAFFEGDVYMALLRLCLLCWLYDKLDLYLWVKWY